MDSKEVDFRSLDWDDSELIKAYDKGMEKKKAELRRLKNGGKAEPSKKAVKAEWKTGDFCRALYTLDKQYYEAKVVLIEGDFCMVQFLGYGDQEEVATTHLKETLGKKARKKQIKAAKDFYSENNSNLASGAETNDESSVSVERPRADVRPTASHPAPQNQSFREPEEPIPQRNSNFTMFPDPFTIRSMMRNMGDFDLPPNNQNLPSVPTPPAPLMPQCSSLSQDPALSSMLVSWYMSGYYTGIYQGQKMARCSQHCCARAGSCHH